MNWLEIRVAADVSVFTTWKKWGRKFRSKRRLKVCYATLAAVVYHVWCARNAAV